ncbi:hypothetical protein EAF07_03570 [Streptococcus hillyeri]|uniref:Uncharacterized protein n=1 Tax=Streptococcus hillyeri TaxID=2282420 RepID=A0A3L9DS70_9STRE|nr:hypothetical protein EAF07_03570 [Streptococcus hillyeri]
MTSFQFEEKVFFDTFLCIFYRFLISKLKLKTVHWTVLKSISFYLVFLLALLLMWCGALKRPFEVGNKANEVRLNR